MLNRLAVALLILVAACKDDPPPNEPGGYGEACEPGEFPDTPDGCVEGLDCWISGNQGLDGFCNDVCEGDDECGIPTGGQSLTPACIAGVCTWRCVTANDCPQDLPVGPLMCSSPGNVCTVADP